MREPGIAVIHHPVAQLAGLRERLRGRVRAMPGPLLAAVIALALAAGLVAVDGAVVAGHVRPGVSVAGTDLSGLGPADAATRLEVAAATIEAQPLEVRVDTASQVLTKAEAGIELDVPATVAAALAVGRHGPLDGQRLLSRVGGVDVPWLARLDEARLTRLLAALDRQMRRPRREPALRVTDGAAPVVELVPGRPGRSVDLAAARPALLTVAGPGGDLVTLPVATRQPAVTRASADAALAQARALLGAPVEVTSQGRSAELRPGDLAPLLRSKAVGDRLTVRIDEDGLDELLRRRAAFAYVAPQDAGFQAKGTEVKVVPAVAGQAVHPARAAAALLAVATRAGAERRVSLPTVTEEPKLTTAKAKALGVRERISTFTTTFSAADAPRVHNIGLIAASVNGSLVMPGEVFSMNGATGRRTAAKGYRTAHVIVNGELVDGLGGGVCQAGTTMFNTVLLAGVPVLERRNHSLHISHYPMGRDATLNWPNADLKFRNDSPYGIYVTSRWTASSLTFALYSTSRHLKVSLSTSAATNFRSPGTRFVDDPGLPMGTEVVEEPGSSGFDVTVFRTVTSNGKVVRRDQFVSNYSPWTRIVRRGTGKPEGAPAPGSPEPGTLAATATA
ncbi:MAG TPA: VanW family protein [Actinomycetes bacterium]|jgi:vancomycin resistance protein YoaR|nr:VanW family protein [Actinomycetes bacterium]